VHYKSEQYKFHLLNRKYLSGFIFLSVFVLPFAKPLLASIVFAVETGKVISPLSVAYCKPRQCALWNIQVPSS
ncbi:MAG: hypothetical protein LBH19_13105, partial [Dysgonamonadaceae bacterium]|nr:hypothetical protein [Dysgonamonadaceae bacterium]